jgi:hypothetical protein
MTAAPRPAMTVAATGPERATARVLEYWLRALSLAVVAYFVLAYLVLPNLWRLIEHRHRALQSLATHAVTSDGIPGDPINIVLIGSEASLQRCMLAHGWLPADPITLESSLRIAADSVVHRPYETAPVSNLYYWGHKPELMFEQMIGGDPRRRHHVRFWKSGELDDQGRPLWAGAATLDTRAGVSHLTGQLTHHIDAAIDQERDMLVTQLNASLGAHVAWLNAFQPALRGRNGGGDPYVTDGRLAIVTLP